MSQRTIIHMVPIMNGLRSMNPTFCRFRLFHVFFLLVFRSLQHFHIKRDENTIESVKKNTTKGKKNTKKLNNQINLHFLEVPYDSRNWKWNNDQRRLLILYLKQEFSFLLLFWVWHFQWNSIKDHLEGLMEKIGK